MRLGFVGLGSAERSLVATRMRATCTAIFLAVLLVGCSGRLQKPEVSLAGVDLVGFGLLEQRFVLKVRIRNPNDVELPINALSFEVELDGRHFARGVSEKPVVVPRQGESVLDVNAASRLGAVLKPLRDAQKEGRDRINYRVYGDIELEGRGRYPFERTGEVPLPRL